MNDNNKQGLAILLGLVALLLVAAAFVYWLVKEFGVDAIVAAIAFVVFAIIVVAVVVYFVFGTVYFMTKGDGTQYGNYGLDSYEEVKGKEKP